MIAKLGFFVLIIAFGVLAFLAGMAMPEKFLQQLPVLAQIKLAVASANEENAGSAEKSDKSKEADTPKEAAADPARAEDEPPPIKSLMIPSPPPANGSYGLQLGLFPDEGGADAMAAKIGELHLPGVKAKTVQVRGKGGQDWWVAYAGDEKTPGDLERTKRRLEESLQLHSIRPMLLPALAKPKAGSDASLEYLNRKIRYSSSADSAFEWMRNAPSRFAVAVDEADFDLAHAEATEPDAHRRFVPVSGDIPKAVAPSLSSSQDAVYAKIGHSFGVHQSSLDLGISHRGALKYNSHFLPLGYKT